MVPVIQVQQRAAKPAFELKRYDNSTHYSLTSSKDFTVSRAISDWIKYKLSSPRKKD